MLASSTSFLLFSWLPTHFSIFSPFLFLLSFSSPFRLFSFIFFFLLFLSLICAFLALIFSACASALGALSHETLLSGFTAILPSVFFFLHILFACFSAACLDVDFLSRRRSVVVHSSSVAFLKQFLLRRKACLVSNG